MIRTLARDAVRIKMAAKAESPLISVYEFCYAAGYGCRILGLSRGEADALIAAESFADLKARVQERVKGGKEAFAAVTNGERLLDLIQNCRFRGQMDEDARGLFEMGYSGQ